MQENDGAKIRPWCAPLKRFLCRDDAPPPGVAQAAAEWARAHASSRGAGAQRWVEPTGRANARPMSGSAKPIAIINIKGFASSSVVEAPMHAALPRVDRLNGCSEFSS